MAAAMSRPSPSDKNAPGWDNHGFLNGWENIIISSAQTFEGQHLVGKSIAEIARERNTTPEETVLDILLEEKGDAGMLVFTMSEECLVQALKHPAAHICTDGLLGGRPHPRVYGAFPRILNWYVRGKKLFSLEAAIRKMTFLSARRLGLHDRGRLKPGLAADVVVFDPAKIEDTATYANPRQYPKGISQVFVNGTHAVKDGQFTGRYGGRVLRGSKHPAK
jgi:N-acyl-D-amino-acid deacylase